MDLTANLKVLLNESDPIYRYWDTHKGTAWNNDFVVTETVARVLAERSAMLVNAEFAIRNNMISEFVTHSKFPLMSQRMKTCDLLLTQLFTHTHQTVQVTCAAPFVTYTGEDVPAHARSGCIGYKFIIDGCRAALEECARFVEDRKTQDMDDSVPKLAFTISTLSSKVYIDDDEEKKYVDLYHVADCACTAAHDAVFREQNKIVDVMHKHLRQYCASNSI